MPFAGALAGTGLNYAFMDFYQQMARVHFTVRALERKYGGEDTPVRACFDGLVRQARDRRRSSKPVPDKEEAALDKSQPVQCEPVRLSRRQG